MSTDNNFNLFCKFHNKKIAKRFCSFCNEYLCNGCSLNGTHIKHIEKLISIYDEISNYKIYKIDNYYFKGNFYKDAIILFNYILNFEINSNSKDFDLYYTFRKIEILINDTIEKLISLKKKYKDLYDNNLSDVNNLIKENEKIILNTQNILLNKINNNKEIISKINDLFEKVNKEKDYGKIMNYYNENKEIINDCLGNDENIEEKIKKFHFIKQLTKYKGKFDFYGDNIIKEINPTLTKFKSDLDSFYNLIDGKDVILKQDLIDIVVKNKLNINNDKVNNDNSKNPNALNLYEISTSNVILNDNINNINNNINIDNNNNPIITDKSSIDRTSNIENVSFDNNNPENQKKVLMSEFFTSNKENLLEKDYKTQKIKELYSSFFLTPNFRNSSSANTDISRDSVISELHNLSRLEINMTELILLKENSSKALIYNIFTNLIEEVETGFKFPNFFSSILINPYIYISGGIDQKNTVVNYIIRFRRNSEKQFIYNKMGNLKTKHYNHSSIYIPFLNSIFIISGSKNKCCEYFNITNEKIDMIPSLNYSRENCGLCLINEKILYAFLGFDRSISKFLTSFEKLDLNNFNNKLNNNNDNINNDFIWEIFNISGIPNLMKKTLFSSFYYKNKDKDGILIIGGKNHNRKECNDVLFFDINDMKIDNFENSDLNSPCCFNNTNFISFDFNSNNFELIYNISKDSKVYLFDCKIGKFVKTT